MPPECTLSMARVPEPSTPSFLFWGGPFWPFNDPTKKRKAPSSPLLVGALEHTRHAKPGLIKGERQATPAS